MSLKGELTRFNWDTSDVCSVLLCFETVLEVNLHKLNIMLFWEVTNIELLWFWFQTLYYFDFIHGIAFESSFMENLGYNPNVEKLKKRLSLCNMGYNCVLEISHLVR